MSKLVWTFFTINKFRPGTVALRDIRKYQKSTDLLIQKAPFERIVRAYGTDIRNHYHDDGARFSENSIVLLQGFVENFVTQIYERAQELAIHSGRMRINLKDVQLALKYSGVKISTD